MERRAYERFAAIRDDFKSRVTRWTGLLPGLADAQRELARLSGDEYPLETPIVYNLALDEIRSGDLIRWLVVADNPGKREQEAAMNRYLVGRSGLAAERFFGRELGVDFRREVAIINKTPVHTPKTAQLRKLVSLYPAAAPVLRESQAYMASIVPTLQSCLGARVWVMGLSELRPKGLFEPWRIALEEAYEASGPADGGSPGRGMDGVYCLNHFSMGSFATELARRRRPGETSAEAALRIGAENRPRLFGAR